MIRRVADKIGLDPATVRDTLETANIAEADIEERFDEVCSIVSLIADPARITGHGSKGRGEAGGGNITEFAQVRAEHVRAQIEKMRIQSQREMGKLIDRADATETIKRLLGDLRATLLAMGGKLAPSLIGQSDVRIVAKIVDTEVRRTLTAFSDEGFVAALDKDALS